MCRATSCKICGKTTWTGCGQHVDQVRAQVPSAQWCPGQHTDREKASAPKPPAFLDRLRQRFGR
ncbi:hypothetical protein Kisp02_41320 [Kineosporia sp. NBRC 101731]|nr:hypothetical protein Kisp02_41320 [Kineosporia sp. NBRC 101731]